MEDQHQGNGPSRPVKSPFPDETVCELQADDFDDFSAVAIPNLWQDTMGTAEQNKVYVVQTVSKVIQRCILMTTDPGDLVLDPTCGSGTTAYVAEQWGRRWITIDTSRVASRPGSGADHGRSLSLLPALRQR